MLGVVGESGCGKCTLARAMLGLVPAAAGAIELDGGPVASDWRALRRRVQMVFQDPYQTLNPRMRVRAIVAEPLQIAGTPPGDRVERALEDVGLPPGRFADRYPHELSGDQRQRVAVAASLVLDPDALICDEPVSTARRLGPRPGAEGVDGPARVALARLLFITHDLGLAWTLCDRIAVMYLDRIVEQGSAAQLIEHPRHPYTQALVAAVPSPGREQGAKLLSGRAARRRPHPSGLPAASAHRAACLLLSSESTGVTIRKGGRAPRA